MMAVCANEHVTVFSSERVRRKQEEDRESAWEV